MKVCAIEDCDGKHFGRGWCEKHYKRWRRTGSPHKFQIGRRHLLEFIHSIIDTESTECIVYAKTNFKYRYLQLEQDGRRMNAHRYVCELKYGPAKPPKNHSAHSCGNSHCLNPNHLRWATCAENQQDRILHGTSNRGANCGTAKLTASQALRIRERHERQGHSAAEIAKDYPVTQTTIADILKRRTWAWL